MFIHRVRPMTIEEAADFAGLPCMFDHYDEIQPPAATHRIFGTEGGHRVGNVCCRECAAEIRADVIRRQVPATPVTHGESDESYDGRKDYIHPMALSR